MTHPLLNQGAKAACLAAMLAMAVTACHSREVEVAAPPVAGTYPVDCSYLFRIDYREGTRTQLRYSGHFIIADSVFVLESPSCEAIDAPRGSEGNEEAWFRCGGEYSGRPLQLRFNRSDPLNKSRWFADLPVREPARRCARYSFGSCVRVVNTFVLRYVPRSGEIEVRRGLPPERPFSPQPGPGDRTRRARCDTIATFNCPG
jgi:hypothetical protein